jgi:hypothetical protein
MLEGTLRFATGIFLRNACVLSLWVGYGTCEIRSNRAYLRTTVQTGLGPMVSLIQEANLVFKETLEIAE